MTQTKKSWLQEREGKTYLLEQLCCRCENPLRDNDYDKHHELNGRYLCADCRSQILNNQSNMIKEKSKTFKFGLSQDVRAQKEEVQRHVKEEVQHHGYSCQVCCRCKNPLRDNDYDKHHELNGRYLCADCRSQILNNQSNMIKEKSKTFKFGLSQDVRAQKEEVQRHVKEEVQHHGYSC